MFLLGFLPGFELGPPAPQCTVHPGQATQVLLPGQRFWVYETLFHDVIKLSVFSLCPFKEYSTILHKHFAEILFLLIYFFAAKDFQLLTYINVYHGVKFLCSCNTPLCSHHCSLESLWLPIHPEWEIFYPGNSQPRKLTIMKKTVCKYWMIS